MVNAEFPTATTISLIEQFIGDEGEPLYGADSSEGEMQIGRKRLIIPTRNEGGIWAGVIDKQRKARAMRNFERMLSLDLERPISGVRGQIIFQQDAGRSECTGDIYLTDEEAVCSMRTSIHPDDIATLALQECFEAPDLIGVGGNWTLNMLATLRGEAKTVRPRREMISRNVSVMSDPAISFMNTQLSIYLEDMTEI